MDSANTLSKQEALLLHIDQPQHHPLPSKKPRIKNPKTKIIFAFLILVILIAGSITLYSICKKKRKPEQRNAYLAGLSQYYCHLTPYPELCYSSMSSMINTTAVRSNPGPIFTTTLRVAINELNATTLSITKALSSTTTNNPLVGPGLSKCHALMLDSTSRLNKSLGLVGIDPDSVESLTYEEVDTIMAWARAATKNVGECILALEEIDHDKEVAEVKLGVEKANKHVVNCIWLFRGRESIVSDFYFPFYLERDDDYDYYYFNFKYRDLVCLYSAMYLFVALLYFLFWRTI